MKALTDLLSSEELHKITNFPFKSVLSFDKLINAWEEMAESPNQYEKRFATDFISTIKEQPALAGLIYDENLVIEHNELVQMMMLALFAKAGEEGLYSAVSSPFGALPFYATPAMQTILNNVTSSEQMVCNMDLDSIMQFKSIYAAFNILERIYGFEDLTLDNPMQYDIPDPETGRIKHFKVEIDTRFADVVLKGKKQKISREQVDEQLLNIEDAQGWLNLLDAERYEFQGFVIMNWRDITREVNFSLIQQTLLENTTEINIARLFKLENNIKEFLGIDNLSLGLTLLEEAKNDKAPNIELSSNSIVAECDKDLNCSSNFGSILQKMIDSDKPYLITDLKKHKQPSAMEITLLNRGVRNILLIPVSYENVLIGYMELYSKLPNQITTISLFKLRSIVPVMSMAMRQAKEAISNDIEATIKDKFTAIHPVVEWKFIEVAKAYLKVNRFDKKEEVAPIIFKGVYPLYGQSDIRNSTIKRNQAVQEDLGNQLKIAQNVLKRSYKLQQLPLIEEMEFRIGKFRTALKHKLGASDESSIQEFLKFEIEPVFEHLKKVQPELNPELATYYAALDPEMGFISTKRHEYEVSLNTLNDHIANQIEAHQAEAQKVFPHYFEKYKTDGVEYNIYIGDSLVSGDNYDSIYLKNLRIWQLISLSRVAVENEKLRHTLPIPMQTAQLILVHSNPLDIRFRMDEKRFDVDGAYNIRYEIIKKRIDKAVIFGSGERITGAGKITIVLEQDKDAAEYMRYIEFLQSRGIFSDKVEDFRLEPMQGIQGMRALRVTVNVEMEEIKDIDIAQLIAEEKS